MGKYHALSLTGQQHDDSKSLARSHNSELATDGRAPWQSPDPGDNLLVVA